MRQHYIPQSYLKAWCDPASPSKREPYVWVFPREGGHGKKKAPKNIFHETHMYTVEFPGQAPDFVLEQGLSELESRFVQVRRNVIDARRDIDDDSRIVVSAFAAAMHARTRNMRDHMMAFFAEMEKTGAAAIRSIEAMTPEERAALPPPSRPLGSGGGLSHRDVQKIAQRPVQNLFPHQFVAELRGLVHLDLAILESSSAPGFVTSDDPCAWDDPELDPSAFLGPGLASESIEISLPLSPRHLAFFNRQGLKGYTPVSEALVDGWNYRTLSYADEFVVVRENRWKAAWLDLA